MSEPRQPGWRANLALAVAAVVATFVLAEIGLQAAALVVRATTHRSSSAWSGSGQLKLLTLGDSNTYGLGVEEQEAYPQVLQATWNASAERPRLEVINLGFPGTSSSQLVNRLPKLLAMLRPDIVTIMVGINDFWTAPEPIGEAMGWRERADFFAWRYSRLYRLLLMVRRSWQVQTIDIPRTPSRGADPLVVQVGEERVQWHFTRMIRKGETLPPRTPLGDNLATLAGQAAAANVELVLLTYPADFPVSGIYANANRQMRDAAAASGIRLIDLGPRIGGICTREACDSMLPDYHPNPLGHRRAAALIAEELLAPRSARR